MQSFFRKLFGLAGSKGKEEWSFSVQSDSEPNTGALVSENEKNELR